MGTSGRYTGTGFLYGEDEGRLPGRCGGHDVRRREGLGGHSETSCAAEERPPSDLLAWRRLYQRLGLSDREHTDGGFDWHEGNFGQVQIGAAVSLPGRSTRQRGGLHYRAQDSSAAKD